MLEHAGPIVGRLIAEEQTDLASLGGRGLRSVSSPQRVWRAAEQRQKRLVESADAPETRGKGDLGHWQRCLVNELFCEQHAAGLSDGHGGRAEVFPAQAPELPLPDAKPLRQRVDSPLVESSQL